MCVTLRCREVGLARMHDFSRFKSNHEALAVSPTSGFAAQDGFVGVGRRKLTETGLSSALTQAMLSQTTDKAWRNGPTVNQEKQKSHTDLHLGPDSPTPRRAAAPKLEALIRSAEEMRWNCTGAHIEADGKCTV